MQSSCSQVGVKSNYSVIFAKIKLKGLLWKLSSKKNEDPSVPFVGQDYLRVLNESEQILPIP